LPKIRIQRLTENINIIYDNLFSLKYYYKLIKYKEDKYMGTRDEFPVFDLDLVVSDVKIDEEGKLVKDTEKEGGNK
jgi:hypothetical protein